MKVNFQNTTGDVLDILITQVDFIRSNLGMPRTADFNSLVMKINAIKQDIPSA